MNKNKRKEKMDIKILLIISFLGCSFVGRSQSTFYNLGRNYADLGNYEEAIRLTKQSINEDYNNSDKFALLLDYNALCEYYSYTTMADSCQLYASKVIDIWKFVNGIEYSDVLENLSHNLLRAGFSQQAINYRKELVNLVKLKYGASSPQLLFEYRILSAFGEDAGDFPLAIEYAKLEEQLAYTIRNIENDFEYQIPYSNSFNWLTHVIQHHEEPIAGIQYLLNCQDKHGEALDEECRKATNCAMWNIIVDNYLMDDVIGVSDILDKRDKSHFPSDLAKKLIDVSDTIADNYIQNRAWHYFNEGNYELGMKVSEKVLKLRENLFGKASQKWFEWIQGMAYYAFLYNDFASLCRYCEEEVVTAEKVYGLNSNFFEAAISSIKAYAHNIGARNPDFTISWIEPYYTKIRDNNILRQYQYEYEIILLADYILLGDLRTADHYAHKLLKWTYSDTDIPLNDKVRIYMILANYHHQIGDDIRARISINEGWKLLEQADQEPDLAQLIDRHNIEHVLRMDPLNRPRINSEWLIESSEPIIEANKEAPEILAVFYESMAIAYEEQNNYELAITNLIRAIELNPLRIDMKLKLAQLYMSNKDYDLAEKQYLDLYNNVGVTPPNKKCIESDLTSLYWLTGDREKMQLYLSIDSENMKSDVRNAFAFLNEQERELFLEKSLLGSTLYFDLYTGYSKGVDQWKEGNEMAYNLSLVQKGFLLSTTKDIDMILKNAPDSIQDKIAAFNDLKSNELHNNPIFGESQLLREIRLELMQYVVENPQFLKQLNYTWKDVKNRLNDKDAAIEFINLWGVTPEKIKDGEPSLGALIIRKDSKFPMFVKLATDSIITELYEYGEDGERLNDMIYSGKTKKELYDIIWKPLLPYLTDIETVYYSPTGVLQDINLDWICDDDTQFLSEKYNLYRLSSTRELCNDKVIRDYVNTILYGDIEYSISNSQLSEFPKSKYRSTTRSGFCPLKGTAIELDSITATLDSYKMPSKELRKDIATEASFRNISGNSPKILHIATHGFYYSNEALENEYKDGNFSNFIAFQGMNPELLYHSGLALSGAQDTWINDTGDIQKYNDMDSNNDGILLSAEISKLDLSNTDLVVLSACETALGNVKSEGVYGLQRAFKLAGVNSIIMSLWKVDDEATQLLMTAFYQDFLNGMSKREALLNAQNKVKNTPGFEDPYYWAAFILLDGLN